MSVLKSYGATVESVFDLLGTKENDITLSISWALAQCPAFLKNLIARICGFQANPDDVTVYNQQHESDHGITDIEITDHKEFHIVIEAKRGWIVPCKAQLEQYSLKDCFTKTTYPRKNIVTLSECSEEYVRTYKTYADCNEINGVALSHLSYKEIYKLAKSSYLKSNHKQKNLLNELCVYLEGIMTMQNKDSNWVYVVSLSKNHPEGCLLSYIDIVNKLNKYFCPVGNGWPKEPPNYIAFRFEGRLQSIHHIESYTIERNLHRVIDEMPDFERDADHFVFQLGPAIVPTKTVKTGNIYPNGRVRAMLDTLLTCDTVSEARDVSQKR